MADLTDHPDYQPLPGTDPTPHATPPDVLVYYDGSKLLRLCAPHAREQRANGRGLEVVRWARGGRCGVCKELASNLGERGR